MDAKKYIDELYKIAAYSLDEVSSEKEALGGGAAVGAIGGSLVGRKNKVKKMEPAKNFGGKVKNNMSALFGKNNIKGTLGKGLIGAGIGAGVGLATNKLERNTQMQKLSSEESLIPIIDTFLKSREGTWLEDIEHCEGCGYSGRPDDKGRCPVCNLVGGELNENLPEKRDVSYEEYRESQPSVSELIDMESAGG